MTVLDDDEASLLAYAESWAPRNGHALPSLGLDVTSRMVDGASFILDEPDTVPAVWGEGDRVAWAAGELLIIGGPPGVGKTTLVGQVTAGRLGVLDSTLGWPVAPGARRVLYLAGDRPKQIARAMARLFTPDDREVLADKLRVWRGPPPADLAAQPETLLRLAEEADADTVILDSLKDMAIGLATDEVGAGLNNAIQRTLVEGVEVLALHHQRKATGEGSKPKSLEDVYGSTWITAGAGSVILLWGKAGDAVVELTHLKQPADDLGPLQIEHDHHTGRSAVTRGFDALRWLRLLTHGGTARDCAAAWFEAATPDRNQTVKAKRTLDALVKKGHAHREDGTKGGAGGSSGDRYHATEHRSEDPR